MKIILDILLLLLLCTLSGAQNECNAFNASYGCECLQQTLQLRCENIPLTGESLQMVGKSFGTSDVTFHLLYIKGTDLVTIEGNTFNKGTQFETVFIEKNYNLTKIADNAFASLALTTKLYVTNNSKLSEGLFTLLPKTNVLTEVDFRSNYIPAFSTGSFGVEELKNLAYIRLDGQNHDSIDVKAQSFAKLPKLTQLTLDNTNLKLSAGSIDLSDTSNKTGHVEIYIRNSNISEWSSTYLVLPKDDTSVWLDLIGNPIGDALMYDQFKDFFKTLKNKLFIRNNDRDCNCKTVKEFLKLNINSTSVNGLVCDNIDDCLD